MFETADVYGKGALETCLGERLRGAPTSYVVTKVGTYRSGPPEPEGLSFKRFDPRYLKDAVSRSRDCLGRERIDVVLLHNPSASTLAHAEASNALKELKMNGVIGAWGVSAGDAYVARSALGHGAEVIEMAYNVFFSRELHELGPEILESKTAVLARSILSYGLLAGHYPPSHAFDASDHRGQRWTRPEFETRLRQLDALRPLVSGDVFTLRAAAVRFVLANNMVSSAVLGPKDVSQLEQLVREAGTEPPYLPEDALGRLATDLAHAGVVT